MKQLQALTLLSGLYIATLLPACNNNGKSASPEVSTANTDTPSVANTIIFDKLVGTWKKEDGNSFEKWTKNEDGSYHIVAFGVKGTDTSWYENARVIRENNNWVFENTVQGQNNGKAVRFTSTLLNDSSVQFTNAAHDFPTDINYTIKDPATVHAFIIGPNNKGGKDTIPFNYSRY